ncbi:CoaD Phosphopantetheine adenylyltransferase [Rhabdaerophilaceae bacterium]
MPHIGLYAGSFDPPTNGHLDVIRRALAIVDKLVIAIGIHPGKAPIFSVSERISMIETSVAAIDLGKAVSVITFDDLTVQAARRVSADILIRGLRDGTDLDYEMQLAGMNGTLAPEIQTIFVPASPPVRPITATLVRQIASLGGDVSGFVPPAVLTALKSKFPTRG